MQAPQAILRTLLPVASCLAIAMAAQAAEGLDIDANRRIPAGLADLVREPITRGNNLELLIGGTEFYPRRLSLIEKAEREIDVFMFLWCPDEAGSAVAEALAAAALRGVRVRVAVDFFNRKGAGPLYNLMEQAGAELYIFNPPKWGWRVNDRMHEKIMLVDGDMALLGGANLCDEYMLEDAARGLWQDYEVVVTGPSARALRRHVDDAWGSMVDRSNHFRGGYAAVAGASPRLGLSLDVAHDHQDAVVEGNPSSPDRQHETLLHYQRPYHSFEASERSLALYCQLFASANSRIIIHTPYMAPPRAFKEALIDAASRGVSVQILTNSPDTNDLSYLFSLAARARYRRLIEGGVEIFESPSKTIHGKAIIIDDSIAAVGSHNFTHRSFFHNNELKLITTDPAVIERLTEVFDGNLTRFRVVTAADLEAKEPRCLFWLLGRGAGRLF